MKKCLYAMHSKSGDPAFFLVSTVDEAISRVSGIAERHRDAMKSRVEMIDKRGLIDAFSIEVVPMAIYLEEKGVLKPFREKLLKECSFPSFTIYHNGEFDQN